MSSYQNSTVTTGAAGAIPKEDVGEAHHLLVQDGAPFAANHDGSNSGIMGTPLRERRSKVVAAALVLGLAVVAVLAYCHPASSSSSLPSAVGSIDEVGAVTLLGSASPSGPAACTFEECRSSMCTPSVAPYTCLFHNGGVHGGCSPTPWTEETCTKQCDLSGCASLPIPDTVKDCSGACTDAWCKLGRLCGPTASYQCTSGASTFGCGSDPYYWTVTASVTACSSCCDTNTCAGGEGGSN
jgi:hypothetical protein